jgi:O-antigen ligase
MNREVLDRYGERGILGLVLAILIFGPLALGAVRGLEFSVIEGLTAGVAILWIARLWVSPKPKLLWPPICWAVLAFAAYAVCRYLNADVEYVARQELLRIIVYTFLFLAILNNLHRQETTTIITFSLVFLAMVISGYAIYQFLRNSDYVWHFIKPYPHRGSGTYICPNHLGGFLEMLLPLALAYTLTGRLKPLTRIVLGYAALVMLAGIAVTLSRGTWAATLAALVLFFTALTFRRQHRLPAIVLLGCIVVTGVLTLPKSYFIQERLNRLKTAEAKMNDDMRFALWGPALKMWRDNPWFGVGPGHFDTRFRGYRPEGVQLTPDRAHNDYLNTLADWGTVGAALVLSAWVCLAAGIFQTWRSRRLASSDIGGKTMSNKYAFMLGGSLGLVAILIHSFVDFNMQIPANAILAITLMALLTGHLRFATERYWFSAALWSRCLITGISILGLVYLAPQAWRRAREFVWLDRAEHQPVASLEQIASLQRAATIDPQNPQTALSLGEAFRKRSQEGGEHYEGQPGMDYRKLAEQAMAWFKKSIALNRWDSRGYIGYGWCLDWLERTNESGAFFSRAEELDPNNYFNLNEIGIHYVMLGDYAAAGPWFERSSRLEWQGNDVARNYLAIVQQRMLEAATNNLRWRLGETGRQENGEKRVFEAEMAPQKKEK